MKTILPFLALAALAGTGCSTPQKSTTTTTTSATTVQHNPNVKIIDGKQYVWLPAQLGSNIPGRWVPIDSPAAQAAGATGSLSISDIQNTQNFPGESADSSGAKAPEFTGHLPGR